MRASRPLWAILDPQRVAVVGASNTEGSPGWVLWRNLESFPGERVPVSRSATEINGVTAYPTLRDVPGPIDLAVIAVPAAKVPGVIDDAVTVGVRACVIVSGGFAETGPEGERLQTQIAAAAREADLLVVGPNCLGVQNCDLPLNASLSTGAARGGGGISIITQSGSYAMALNAMSDDEGVGFAVAYSSGNRCDVDDSEVIDYLRLDDRTRVICLFAESIADGELLLDVARRTTPAKPLIVAAVGRSEAGARAAASHTGALAAERRAWNDVMTAVGITVARSGLEMLDAAKALALQPVPRGARAAIITNSGGTGTELADLLSVEDIVVPPFSPGLRARLESLMPTYASAANPVDVTPAWTRFVEMYPAVIDEVARSGEVDVVIPVLLHRSAENADVARAIITAVHRLRADGVRVPVYCCWVARRSAWPVAALLQEAGIPCLEWPERTARAVGHAVRYAGVLGARGAAGPPRPEPDRVARSTGGGKAGEATSAQGGQGLLALLAEHGIPFVETRFCATVREAEEAALSLGFPVVAKVDHKDLSHKTDVGGVRVSLSSIDAVAEAATDLLALVDGALVAIQRQVTGVELVIGGLREPTFGPVVALGLGGVFVESIGEVCFAPAPLDEAAAVALVERSRAAGLLAGVRGESPVEARDVAPLICAVGDLLMAHPNLIELDLNPVIVGGHGVVAVDARATWTS